MVRHNKKFITDINISNSYLFLWLNTVWSCTPLVSTRGFFLTYYYEKYIRIYKKIFGSYKKYLNLALQTKTQ